MLKSSPNKKKIFAFDIDGVICTTVDSEYEKATPNEKAIEKINKIFSEGNKVIIFTARYMGRTNNNLKEAKALGYKKTMKQLKNWGLNFHELHMGKPSYDILVDDKAYEYSENWIKKL